MSEEESKIAEEREVETELLDKDGKRIRAKLYGVVV